MGAADTAFIRHVSRGFAIQGADHLIAGILFADIVIKGTGCGGILCRGNISRGTLSVVKKAAEHMVGDFDKPQVSRGLLGGTAAEAVKVGDDIF